MDRKHRQRQYRRGGAVDAWMLMLAYVEAEMGLAIGNRTFDVIVAGAGPVGLTLAIDLGRRGVRCLLMERNATTAPWPKMDRSNARTMELYRRIGIVDRVRALGYPPENPMDVFIVTRLCDPPLAVLRYPSVAECRARIAACRDGSLPLEPYQLVSQNKLEPLLKEVAEATPNVTVRYGCELVDFAQDETGVSVVARLLDGSEETLRASYLAGCDGGASTVRKQLGIKLEGLGRIQDVCQVVFGSKDLYERIPIGKGRHYNFAHSSGSVLIAQGCRTEFTLNTTLPPDTDFEPLIRDLIGFPCEIEIRQMVQWRQHLLVAEHYRERRVFLAGDAVHLVIPTGGLGMNTGVGDAFDLSWKLAGVIKGWGGPGLLDAYQQERRPVGLRNRDAAGWAAAGVPSGDGSSPARFVTTRRKGPRCARKSGLPQASIIAACTTCEVSNLVILMQARRSSPMSLAMFPNGIPATTRRTPGRVSASRICGSRTGVPCRTCSASGIRSSISRDIAKPGVWKRRSARLTRRSMCCDSTSRTRAKSITVRCCFCARTCISPGADTDRRKMPPHWRRK